jgi:hypothetical protein
MFDTSWLWRLVTRLPLGSGPRIHRAALGALERGDHAVADLLCERAAARYRRELDVRGLARLRVHQLIARSLGGGVPQDGEIERRLSHLSRIEALERPFELIEARALAEWWCARSPESESIAPPAAAA